MSGIGEKMSELKDFYNKVYDNLGKPPQELLDIQKSIVDLEDKLKGLIPPDDQETFNELYNKQESLRSKIKEYELMKSYLAGYRLGYCESLKNHEEDIISQD